MRRLALSVGCAAAVTVLAGCGMSTAGEAVVTDPSTDASTVDATTTSAAPDYSLARLCELLSPDEARRMGGSPEGEEGNSIRDGHEQCTWADETSLIVGVQPGARAGDGNTGPGIVNTPITIDGLPAVQSLEKEPVVTCQVLADLPGGNLLGTSAGTLTRGEGKYDACTLAKQMAEIIVPRVKDQ
ncbi:DUF3558 domain-containing protein [Actinophytocola sp.]|uniref:DUF3558 domain-containing protein n=1 Tax=Actinophytocola sp. TaxID=1872138 RepID=UPI003D6A4754